ncbi:MAG TPA: 50S ribosomal protein L23 [Elusimicrobiota bacterium]|jgi:large subunit ribosomal protein L23|nr:50S ribosomal protein L23 [Elusimicrobiota bacterium]
MTTEFNPYEHVIRPVMTERSTILKEKSNQYVFEVAKKSSKTDIKKAIEEAFKVTVTRVRTSSVPGKFRRFGKHEGYRSDWKKAFVTLKEGNTIDLVEQSS